MRKSISLAICLLWLTVGVVRAQTLVLQPAKVKAMTHDEWALQIAYLPDGRQMVSAGMDGRVRFWDAQTGTLRAEVKTNNAFAVSLAVAPSGEAVAVGDSAGTVRLLRATDAVLLRDIKTTTRIVNALAFTPDGKHLATGGDGGTVYLWQVADGKQVAALDTGLQKVTALAFVPRTGQLVVGAQGRPKSEISVWDWSAKKVVQKWAGAVGVRGLSVAADGLIAAAIFRPATKLFLLPGEGNSFAASTALLAPLDEPTPVALFEVGKPQPVHVLAGELGASAVSFAPDSQTLACAGAQGVLLMRRLAGTHFVENGRIDTTTAIDAFAWRPDGKQLAVSQARLSLVGDADDVTSRLTSPFLFPFALAGKDGGIPSFGFKEGSNVTGGSDLKMWDLVPTKSDADRRLWQAITEYFTVSPQASRQQLDKLIADAPTFAEARRAVVIMFTQKDLPQAQKILAEALKNAPDCMACYRSLGEVLMGLEKWNEAQAAFQQALKLKPEYELVKGRLVEAYLRGSLTQLTPEDPGSLQRAEEMLQKALALRPISANLYSNLASIYYFGRKPDAAIAMLETALTIQPDYARAYYNLGHAYRAKGDKEAALRAYRRYVALGEEGEEARVARAQAIIDELAPR